MDVLSVTQSLNLVQNSLSRDEVLGSVLSIRGEVSGFKVVKNHAYFSIKDQTAVLKCVFFSIPQSVAIKIQEGVVVDVIGQMKLYIERGDLQFYIKMMNLQTPVGLLQLRFEELKNKLNKEGIIPKPVEERKRLPAFPKNIGVVASKSSAAFADIVKTIQKRYPVAKILLFHTGVQGSSARSEIVDALRRADKSYCDVIILARGGGSIEDLWCFNEEMVVRAVRTCSKPVIVGVGHEIDHTLSEYAADVIASTPTAAAMQATPDASVLLQQYDQKIHHVYKIVLSVVTRFEEGTQNLARLIKANSPYALLRRKIDRFQEIKNSIGSLGRGILQDTYQINIDLRQNLLLQSPHTRLIEHEERLEALYRVIKGLDPSNILQRGYAWLEKDGEIKSSVVEFAINDRLSIQLKDGMVEVTADQILKGRVGQTFLAIGKKEK